MFKDPFFLLNLIYERTVEPVYHCYNEVKQKPHYKPNNKKKVLGNNPPVERKTLIDVYA